MRALAACLLGLALLLGGKAVAADIWVYTCADGATRGEYQPLGGGETGTCSPSSQGSWVLLPESNSWTLTLNDIGRLVAALALLLAVAATFRVLAQQARGK